MATSSLKDEIKQEHKDIWAVLLAFQSDPVSLVKDTGGQVGPRKYKYVDLNQVVERVVHGRLVAAGCVVIQPLAGKQLLTIIRHVASGTELKSTADLPVGESPQDMGKAITYLRRYSLVSMLGLIGDVDDDAAGFNINTHAMTAALMPKPINLSGAMTADDGNMAFPGAL